MDQNSMLGVPSKSAARSEIRFEASGVNIGTNYTHCLLYTARPLPVIQYGNDIYYIHDGARGTVFKVSTPGFYTLEASQTCNPGSNSSIGISFVKNIDLTTASNGDSIINFADNNPKFLVWNLGFVGSAGFSGVQCTGRVWLEPEDEVQVMVDNGNTISGGAGGYVHISKG